MSTIGDNIRKFRMYNKLSQKDFADRVNRTATVISNWENGVHCPDIETMEKICKVLNVTPNELLGWSKNLEVEDYFEKEKGILIEIERLNKKKDDLDKRILRYYQELGKASK